MVYDVTIALCVLLLIAYAFDLTASKTRLPSVILLLLLGWLVKQLTKGLHIQLPNFSSVLPVLGTLGLILIVLEGALDIEFNKSKLGLIKKSFLGALLPMLALAFLLAFVFSYFGFYGYRGYFYTYKDGLINALPFCVISSAIAIPSTIHLSSRNREFIVYESSFSDILGVLLFNFFEANETISINSLWHFILQIVLILLISLIVTVGLSLLLNRIEHRIKFVPIVILLVLIYLVSKIYHLPGLVFILIFGLSLSNIEELKSFRWIEKLVNDEFNAEIRKFRDLVLEMSFIIRSLFFLLFGYLIETPEIVNLITLPWAIGIVVFILIFRMIQLKISELPLRLLFIAPRGLISILLFLSIKPIHVIPLVSISLIVQVIILTSILMMIGLILTNPKGE